MNANRAPNRVRELAGGSAALLALIALVVGVPLGLAMAVGWPLPHQVPTVAGLRTALTTRGIPDRTMLDALACVAWLAWLSALLSIAEEAVAAIRGRRARRLPVAGAFQPVASRLVAAVLFAALSLGRPQPGMTNAPRAPLALQLRPGTANLTAALVGATAQPSPVQATTPVSQPAGSSDPVTYTVVRNDTLWSIAQRELGNPLRWPEIFALNQGRPQPGGGTLTDPNWIYPGWVLLLPSVANSDAPTRVADVQRLQPRNHLAPDDDLRSRHGGANRPVLRTVGSASHRRHREGETHLPNRSSARLTPASRPRRCRSAAAGEPACCAPLRIGGRSFLCRRRSCRRGCWPPSPSTALSLPRSEAGSRPSHAVAGAGPSGPHSGKPGAVSTRTRIPVRQATVRATPEPGMAAASSLPRLPLDPARPGQLEIGVRGGEPVILDLESMGGLGLCGPESDDVLRAWCAHSACFASRWHRRGPAHTAASFGPLPGPGSDVRAPNRSRRRDAPAGGRDRDRQPVPPAPRGGPTRRFHLPSHLSGGSVALPAGRGQRSRPSARGTVEAGRRCGPSSLDERSLQ